MKTFDSSTKTVNHASPETAAKIDGAEHIRSANARHARNFDRAVMIVARLMFDGMIETAFWCNDNGQYFENSVDIVTDMLEKFQLDSPDGDIVDLFHQVSDDEL